MKFVTAAEVVETIRSNVHGTAAITVELDSNMDGKGKMRTTGNPYAGKGIVKRETLNGMIGYDYGAAVNRLADKEGRDERDAKPHPWGDMDDKRLFRIHRTTGKLYLTMKVQSATVHGFFTPDGMQIADEAIRNFIPEKSKSSTQADLNGEVIARDYSIDNIKVIRAFGQTLYIAENMTEQEKQIAEQKEAAEVNG